MRIEHTEHIDAPVSVVWDLTLDVESWPELTPTMTSIERLDDGALGVGSEVRIKQPGQRARIWTVTDLEHQDRFAWSTSAMGMSMRATHQLAPSAEGTSNRLIVELEGRLAPLAGTLLKLPIRRALATENQGFKTAAERTQS